MRFFWQNEDGHYLPGVTRLIDSWRKELDQAKEQLAKDLKAATTRAVYLNATPARGSAGGEHSHVQIIDGAWIVTAGGGGGGWITPASKQVTIQQQLDMLYKHFGLSLQYEEGKEASVKLVSLPDKTKPRKAK